MVDRKKWCKSMIEQRERGKRRERKKRERERVPKSYIRRKEIVKIEAERDLNTKKIQKRLRLTN